MKHMIESINSGKQNFVFLGEAGSGKSELSLNYAMKLALLGDKPVHFFDMDMTKPLFRSRSCLKEAEEQGIVFHYEEQFMDAPTLVGGVLKLLRDEEVYVVMDVGGDYIGARSIGGFFSELNREYTSVYYVLNAFRPWSANIQHIDGTLGKILEVSKVMVDNVRLVNNPNLGPSTTVEDFKKGCDQIEENVSPYKSIDFACVNESLYDEAKDLVSVEVMPLKLFLAYPW